MFGLFKKKPPVHYQRLDDVVWIDESARQQQFVARARQLAASGTPAVLSSHTPAGQGALAHALGAGAERIHLIDSFRLNPATLLPLIAHGGGLRLMFAEFGSTLMADELLLNQINDPRMSQVQVEFHTSLEAPMMKMFVTPQLRALLEKLGMNREEAIAHPYVTAAVARARAQGR